MGCREGMQSHAGSEGSKAPAKSQPARGKNKYTNKEIQVPADAAATTGRAHRWGHVRRFSFPRSREAALAECQDMVDELQAFAEQKKAEAAALARALEVGVFGAWDWGSRGTCCMQSGGCCCQRTATARGRRCGSVWPWHEAPLLTAPYDPVAARLLSMKRKRGTTGRCPSPDPPLPFSHRTCAVVQRGPARPRPPPERGGGAAARSAGRRRGGRGPHGQGRGARRATGRGAGGTAANA